MRAVTITPTDADRARAGERIKAAHTARFRSRRQAAKALGVDEALLRQWEMGYSERAGVRTPVVVPKWRLVQMVLKAWMSTTEMYVVAALLGYTEDEMREEYRLEVSRISPDFHDDTPSTAVLDDGVSEPSDSLGGTAEGAVGEQGRLVDEERRMVGEAAELLAQAAAILAKIAGTTTTSED